MMQQQPKYMMVGAIAAPGKEEWQPLPLQLPAPRDPFRNAVPVAQIDVTFLFQNAPRTDATERLQTLLRAFASMEQQVSHATLHETRIEMQLDSAHLVIGDAIVAGGVDAVYTRPADCDRTTNVARLAYVVERHAFALRLRIDSSAPGAFISELSQLLVALDWPQAVIVNDTRVVLTLPEYERMNCAALAALRPGEALPTIPRRYTRPPSAVSVSVSSPSPFAVQPSRSRSEWLNRRERLIMSLSNSRHHQALNKAFRIEHANEPDEPYRSSLRRSAMLVLIATMVFPVVSDPSIISDIALHL
jgi:hypothetical protein